jgi:hypothetical protein
MANSPPDARLSTWPADTVPEHVRHHHEHQVTGRVAVPAPFTAGRLDGRAAWAGNPR